MKNVLIGLLLAGWLLGCGGEPMMEEEERGGETAVSPPIEPTNASATTAPATAAPTSPANADVVHVRAVATAPNTWTFHVTVAHPDTGWDDYANGWDVVLPDGTVILPNPADEPFTRLLLHPHETEQPFTRSQSNIVIPTHITTITVRAHDLRDGFGGQEVVVDLTQAAGDDFEVKR